MMCTIYHLKLLIMMTVILSVQATEYLISIHQDTSWTDNFEFYPQSIDLLKEDEQQDIYIHLKKNFSEKQIVHSRQFMLKAVSNDGNIATVSPQYINISFNANGFIQNQTLSQSHFVVTGQFLGRTSIDFYFKAVKTSSGSDTSGTITANYVTSNNSLTEYKESSGWQKLHYLYNVSIARKETMLDHVFLVIVILFVVIVSVGMGCKIDLDVVKDVLKKPVAPLIGFCCQFIIMPLMGFAVVQLLNLEGGQALGFFATGCAPGGGASNVYTYVFKGDVSLSVTMTLISTFASLGMIPLWILTLGQYLLKDYPGNVVIPYKNIITSLLGVLFPVAVGIIIQRKRSHWATKLTRIIKPIFVLFIIFMFTFGVYVNQYIFKLFTPKLMLAGCLLPWCGFICGAFIAYLTRQPLDRIKAIAVETGIQNTGIPIVLMKLSLPQPESDMSLVSPIIVSIFTPIPLIIILAVLEIRNRCFKSQKNHQKIQQQDDEDGIIGKDINVNSAHKESAVPADCELLTINSNNETKANSVA